MATIKHAPGSLADFALCGLALDAYETLVVDEPVLIASRTEVVTCEACRRVIDHVRQSFTARYRYVPLKS